MVAVAFQSAYRAEIHQNDIFLFFKIIFEISTSKWSKNTINLKCKKIIIQISAKNRWDRNAKRVLKWRNSTNQSSLNRKKISQRTPVPENLIDSWKLTANYQINFFLCGHQVDAWVSLCIQSKLGRQVVKRCTLEVWYWMRSWAAYAWTWHFLVP